MSERLPLVDAMISVHGIGPIFADTVLSILTQRTTRFRLRCLVVVDGCPFVDDVEAALTDLEHADLHDLSVIYQKNAGVTFARDRGIDHFMSQSERADYVFFMDGDDLAAPNFLEAGLRALESELADPRSVGQPGWAYADQYHFGDQTHWVQYPSELWGTRFALNNLSQPSSLLSMEMLEAGLRFDRDFTYGIEDWDFWCAAVGAGFYGVHVPTTMMRYRRLLGSRSSHNRANDPMTKYRLTKKHALDKYETLVDRDPRYARHGILSKRPEGPAGVPSPALALNDADIMRLWSQVHMQGEKRKGVVFGDPHVPSLLEVHAQGETAPLPSDVFFMAEHIFHWRDQLIALEIQRCDGPPALVISPRRFFGLARHEEAKFSTINADRTEMHNATVVKGLPEQVTPLNRLALQRLIALLPDLPQRHPAHIERRRVGDKMANPWSFYRQSLGFLPYLPDAQAPTKTQTALILEVGLLKDRELGDGIRALAEDARARGEDPHLVVVYPEGSPAAEVDPTEFGVVAVHGLYGIAPVYKAQTNFPTYNGAPFNMLQDKWSAYATGLLSWFDAVINLGAPDVSFVIAGLKTKKTIRAVYAPREDHRNVQDFMRLGMLVGVYDEVIPPSQTWRDLALGLATPQRAFQIALEDPS